MNPKHFIIITNHSSLHLLVFASDLIEVLDIYQHSIRDGCNVFNGTNQDILIFGTGTWALCHTTSGNIMDKLTALGLVNYM